MTAEVAVIRTKLVAPVRESGLVARERLLSRLAQNAGRSLALVRAPAGYGKTTLVGQWFATLDPASDLGAWYSLDDADNDLGRFFTYLVAAVRLRSPEFGATVLGQLNAGVRLSPASLAGALVNELDAIGRRVHLVLDDFHLIGNAAVLEAMSRIVVNAPAGLHLVIASRESPPLPLGRLRALGRCIEISSEDLRFRGAETGAFMSLAGHHRLSPEQLHTVERRTEGWAAGLQLASISLATRQDAGEFIAEFSGSHRDVADFLTEDVLQRQDQATREFLLQTSILDRLTPALCDAVTGSSNGRNMLDALEAHGLFVFSLDAEREWYRYHHLFAEFLRKRLETEQATLMRQFHRRASQWFGERGYFDEAIKHALAGRDTARAAQLLDETCDQLFYSGRLGALAEWYQQIPPMHLRKFPRILLDQAWSMTLEWRFDAARRMLDDVQSLLDRRRSAPAQRGAGDRLRAILKHREMMYALFRDDMAQVDALCNEMLRDFPVTDPYLRGSLYTCLIYAGRETFDFDSVERFSARAQDLYEQSGSRFVFIWHNSVLGPTELARGNIAKAEASLALARSIAAELSGERSPLAAMPGLLLAEIFYERNQLDAARWLLDEYLPLADQIGFVDQLITGFILQARLHAAAGERAAAEDTLAQAEALSLKHGFERLAAHVAAERVRQALVDGDFETVRRTVQSQFAQTKATELSPRAGSTSRHATMAVTWCRLACINGRADEALALCRKWIGFFRDRGAWRAAVGFAALSAHAHRQRGNAQAAVRALREALTLAREAGFLRTLIDQPEVAPGMLEAIVDAAGSECDRAALHATEILGIRGPRVRAAEPRGSTPWTRAPGEPLTEREQEILELVARGLMNREIAGALGLTEGSVKWHLQGIFDKVGTRRRTGAVQKAREFGLLR
jgi:LuxR family maltose regulon positive regulatory protein